MNDKNYMIKVSKEQISILKKEFEKKVKDFEIKGLMCAKGQFDTMGWNGWSDKQFASEGQYERLMKGYEGSKMMIVSVAADGKSGVVRGSNDYTVSAKGCSCSDFTHRYLPCKHMFFFALHKDIANQINEDQPAPTVPSRDLTIVIAGTFKEMSKDELTALVSENGFKLSGSVSAKNNYLIAGENAGTKRERAEALGVPIITLAQFLVMINK